MKRKRPKNIRKQTERRERTDRKNKTRSQRTSKRHTLTLDRPRHVAQLTASFLVHIDLVGRALGVEVRAVLLDSHGGEDVIPCLAAVLVADVALALPPLADWVGDAVVHTVRDQTLAAAVVAEGERGGVRGLIKAGNMGGGGF